MRERDFGIFKLGQRVICIKEFDKKEEVVDKIGTIIGFIDSVTNRGNICVEFDEYIRGHGGCMNHDYFTHKIIKREYGRCWYLPHHNLKLLSVNKRII